MIYKGWGGEGSLNDECSSQNMLHGEAEMSQNQRTYISERDATMKRDVLDEVGNNISKRERETRVDVEVYRAMSQG